jgi:hypothetical protein
MSGMPSSPFATNVAQALDDYKHYLEDHKHIPNFQQKLDDIKTNIRPRDISPVSPKTRSSRHEAFEALLRVIMDIHCAPEPTPTKVSDWRQLE